MHLIPDSDDPYAIVSRLLSAVPAGSYLAMSHVTADRPPSPTRAGGSARSSVSSRPCRSDEEVLRFSDRLVLAEPGLVRVPEWRPASELGARTPAMLCGGAGRKS